MRHRSLLISALALLASPSRRPRRGVPHRSRRLLQIVDGRRCRQRRPLRGQQRAPQPADRKPHRHRTGVLSRRADDRLRSCGRRLLGPPRRLGPAAADQRCPARLGADRLARRQACRLRATGRGRRRGGPVQREGTGRRPARPDQRVGRRPSGRFLARRQSLSSSSRQRHPGQHQGGPLLDPAKRGTPCSPDQDRRDRRVQAALLRRRASSSAAARAAKDRRHTPTSTRCAATAAR